MPRYVDVDPHGGVRVFHGFATEICHRDLEERGQLLGVAGQATDPAVRVVQDRQVPPAGRLASAHERRASGVTRPPTLRMTTASPRLSPSTSLGSTRESTHPITRSAGFVGKGRPLNAPLAANVAFRWTSSGGWMVISEWPFRGRVRSGCR